MGCATQCWLNSRDSKWNMNCCAEEFGSSEESEDGIQQPITYSEMSNFILALLYEGPLTDSDGKEKWCQITSSGIVFKTNKSDIQSLLMISANQIEDARTVRNGELEFEVKLKEEFKAHLFKAYSKEERDKWVDSVRLAINSDKN